MSSSLNPSTSDLNMDLNNILDYDFVYEDEDFSAFDLEDVCPEKSVNLNGDLLPLFNQALNKLDKEEGMATTSNYEKEFAKKAETSDSASAAVSQPSDIGSQEMMSGWLSQNFNIFDLTENDPQPMDTEVATSTVDTSAIGCSSFTQLAESEPQQQYHNITVKKEPGTTELEPVINEENPSTSSAGINRHRRKAVHLNRNVQDSAMLFVQEPTSLNLQTVVTAFPLKVETDSRPLATLNGSSNRARRTSSASSSAPLTPQPSSSRSRSRNSDDKKKRKYECDDIDDPSVKNAKAAKMNREKKKKQLQDLQGQVNTLKTENQSLRQDLDSKIKTASTTEQLLREQNHRLQLELSEEKKKNSATGMQKVTMLDYMTNFIQTIQPTPSVYMSNQLANLPMPAKSDVFDIRRRMTENPQPIPTDTCLTVKVGIGGQPSIHFDVEESRFPN